MNQPWPDRYFGDVDHLNDQGAAELQPLLLRALNPLTSTGPDQEPGTSATG
jgi:hypothetical protein